LESGQQYSPQYYLTETDNPDGVDSINLNEKDYAILPDPNTIYYLYNSIKLFYDNGGGNAFIVSVGGYGAASGSAMEQDAALVNTNVKLSDLEDGLALLKNESEPTMYICPEATLLSVDENGSLMQKMMLQNNEMMTAVSIFDVIGGRNPDPIGYTADINTFREKTGTDGLKFGAAYYPFIGTVVMGSDSLNYTNLFGGDIDALQSILIPEGVTNQPVTDIIEKIKSEEDPTFTGQVANDALVTASGTFVSIMNSVLTVANLLPPSGGMAGVITKADDQSGPWKAPANTTIINSVSLPIKLTDDQQEGLNVDAVSGKSINAIRFFNGIGILVWGARTLDGNSQDWRYLSVRRTMIFLEQSSKLAARAYVFEPNTKNTWETIKAMIGSFLTGVWKDGGLQGETPADAFEVQCGLGSTMTANDILDGYLNVSVKVAVVRPAEFIVITFQQQMAKS
jgi:hypothetical protein